MAMSKFVVLMSGFFEKAQRSQVFKSGIGQSVKHGCIVCFAESDVANIAKFMLTF